MAGASRVEILVDRASGKLAVVPKLDEALRVAHSGDQLVITKLDRLGRSLEDSPGTGGVTSEPAPLAGGRRGSGASLRGGYEIVWANWFGPRRATPCPS